MTVTKVKNITVFEHQAIKVGWGTFTSKHLDLLEKFRGDKEDEYFPYYSLIHNGVKFKQYVGVLSVGGLQIEVLPKADNYIDDNKENQKTWRIHLLTMLKAVYKLQAKTPTETKQKLRSSPILDVFLQRFLEEVERLLHMGLIKTYRKETENLNALKGKIMWGKQVTKNMIHKERFFVNFTTYDRNHLCNRILYKTLKVIPDITGNSYIANRARTLCFEFPELHDVVVNDTLFKSMRFDRKSEEYKSSIEIAKLILLHYMPDRLDNRNSVLALMFDMNRLWEEYVYVTLRRKLTGYNVSAQKVKRFWKQKTIRPDIVITDSAGETKLVIDTKWKCPQGDTPSDADLKQMYVYHKYWDAPKTVLLYPAIGERVDVLGRFKKNGANDEDDEKLQCCMKFVPIDSIQNGCPTINEGMLEWEAKK